MWLEPEALMNIQGMPINVIYLDPWWNWFKLETKEEIMHKILGKEQKVFKEKKEKRKKGLEVCPSVHG